MMPKTVDFLFDCGAPNAYLVHKVLPAISKSNGVTFNYIPVLLGGIFKATGNLPPMMRYKETPAKLSYENLEFKRFMDAHGISDFKFNPNFPINSIMTMRAASSVTGDDLIACVDAAMAGFWEQGLKMDDPQVFASCMNDAGLDGAALVITAGDDAVKAKLMANTNKAIERGVFGVPTFFVREKGSAAMDGEIFWGKERLEQVEAAALV